MNGCNDCLLGAIMSVSTQFQVERRESGSYVNGRWESQEADFLDVCGSVQIADSEDLQRVEENRRTREAIKIYTQEKLRITDRAKQIQPDFIHYQGRKYEVDSIEDWAQLGGYYKVVALKVDP